MKVSAVFQEPPRASWDDIAQVHERLREASDELAGMTQLVAKAQTVIEYDGEMRKRALALHVREFLAAGDSASAAETKGRASVGYGETLAEQRQAFEAASAIIAQRDACRCRYEAARSILSSLKTLAGI